MNEKHENMRHEEIEEAKPKNSLVFLAIALAVCTVVYHLLVNGKLEQTAALFIGLPTLITIVLALTPSAKTSVGVAMKGTALLLAFSSILMGEGAICILIAAPIFLCVAGSIGWLYGWLSRRVDEKISALRCVVFIPFLVMSMEGATESFEFNREEVVELTMMSEVSQDEFFNALKHPINVNSELPLLLKLGFPAPKSCEGSGLEIGSQRIINFAGGEGEPGDLLLRVSQVSSNSVTFTCEHDSSQIAHWMNWSEITFTWLDGHVHYKASYERLLDPAWYFAPIERYGVEKAGEHLMGSFFNARAE